MKATIHQPNFQPYLGIFNKIKHSDLFVIYDTAQYVRDRFDNRNQIKSEKGPIWLTVPLQVKDSFLKRFFEVKLPEDRLWIKKHLKSIQFNYARAPYFKIYFPELESLYQQPHETLADISTAIILFLMKSFGIQTRTIRATELNLDLNLKSTEMLVAILQKTGAEEYLAGASGRNYMDMDLIDRAGIRVEFQHFTHPVYRQAWGEFIPNMAAIDLLFNEGDNAGNFI